MTRAAGERWVGPVFVAGVPLPKGGGTRKLIPAKCPGCRRMLPGGIGRLGPWVEQANIGNQSREHMALDRWLETIGATVRYRCGAKPVPSGVPVELQLAFYFVRPPSSKREAPTVKPDIDKLERAVLDALTGVLYEDDSQVVATNKRKLYAAHGRGPGVQIEWRVQDVQCSLFDNQRGEDHGHEATEATAGDSGHRA